MSNEEVKNAKSKLGNNYNGFNRWYRTVSLELIGGLLCLLMAILIGIIGWNYACDNEAHVSAAAGIAELRAEKINMADLKPLSDDIRRLTEKHNKDQNRMIDKLDKELGEIKRILMKKYAEEG